MSNILAAVTQRDFWREDRIKELVRQHSIRRRQAMYEHPASAEPAERQDDLRAMRIFVTEKQQTWLLADQWRAYCVLDDRSREEPSRQWDFALNAVLPVVSEEIRDEAWAGKAGVLHFGDYPKGWLYSKELFANEPAEVVVTRFLSDDAG